jgi:endoglucanase
MDYMLGNNPLSFSYITGYGNYGVQNPHHKYWLNEIYQTLPMAPDGILVGGPSAEISDDYIRHLGFDASAYDNSAQRCYADSWEAWSVNDTGLDWNASLAWVVSFLQDEIKPENTEPVEKIVFGDANNDGTVSIADATAILQALGNSDKYKLSDEGAANADVIDNGGGLSVADALAIQAVDAKLVDVKLFPMTQESYDAVLKYDAVIKGE